MAAFRQLAVPARLVAVAAVEIVDAVGREEGVVEVRVEHVFGAALDPDAAQRIVPDDGGALPQAVEPGARRFLHPVRPGPVRVHAGNAGEKRHFLQVVGKGELHHTRLRFVRRQERFGEHGGKIHVPVVRPAAHPAVAQDLGALEGEPVFRCPAPAADAVPRIDPDEPGPLPLEGIAVQAGVGRGGQLRGDALVERDLVVARAGLLVLVRVSPGSRPGPGIPFPKDAYG